MDSANRRRNLFWALTLGLVLTLFVTVAFTNTVDAHFRSWTNWPDEELTSSWVSFCRTLIDALNLLIIPIMLVVGSFLGYRAVLGQHKPYIVAIIGSVVTAILAEWTSSAGQDATRDDAQNVSIISIGVALAIVAVPLIIGLLALRPVTADPLHNAELRR